MTRYGERFAVPAAEAVDAVALAVAVRNHLLRLSQWVGVPVPADAVQLDYDALAPARYRPSGDVAVPARLAAWTPGTPLPSWAETVMVEILVDGADLPALPLEAP